MDKALLRCATLIALSASWSHAQVQVAATVINNPIDVGGITIPLGADVSAGFALSQQTGSGVIGSGSLMIDSSDTGYRAELLMSATSVLFAPAASSGAVEFVVTSSTSMMVDVSLSILSESAPYCVLGQAQLTSGTASAQLLGFGPLTNDHCNPPFPQCTFEFEPQLLDATGLRLRLSATARASSFSRCPNQTATFSCALNVRRRVDVQPYGSACGASLTATTRFSAPGQHEFRIADPGASIGVLMIGVSPTSVPIFGCTLLTDPVGALPLTLDASGEFRFTTLLPPPPFALQAITAQGMAIHMSNGLRGR